MKASGSTDTDKAMEFRYGQMDQNTQEIGIKTKQTVKERSITRMEIPTRDNG